MGTENSSGSFIAEREEDTKQTQSVGRLDLRALLEMQAYRCALSGIALTPDTAELDHIVPASRGGKDDIGNLQWLHKDVNRMKTTMSTDRFLALCMAIADHAQKNRQ